MYNHFDKRTLVFCKRNHSLSCVCNAALSKTSLPILLLGQSNFFYETLKICLYFSCLLFILVVFNKFFLILLPTLFLHFIHTTTKNTFNASESFKKILTNTIRERKRWEFSPVFTSIIIFYETAIETKKR